MPRESADLKVRRRVREWIADDLDRLAVAIWGLAHRIRPVDDGPRCPDCQVGPDVGDNCPVCEELADAQKRDGELYDSGYVDGYSTAAQRYDDER